LAYAKTLTAARELLTDYLRGQDEPEVELWEIERDRYNNKYVIIKHAVFRGRNPKLTLVKRIYPGERRKA